MAVKYKGLKLSAIWLLAVIITISVSIYQKMTGPTYPLKVKTELSSSEYNMALIRSATIGEGCMVEIPVHEAFDEAYLIYHKYPGDFENDTLIMIKDADALQVLLPEQPPAGKIQYYVLLKKNGIKVYDNAENSAIIRFKGDVPLSILIPHIIAMFSSMMFAIVALLMAITNIGNFKKMSYFTFAALLIGGFMFGPIMQYYAFGEAWTGWPVGKDVTDNKTLIAAVFWIIAIVLNIKKPKKWSTIIAAIVMFGVFSIPHSLGGSEYNYEEGNIETGLDK